MNIKKLFFHILVIAITITIPVIASADNDIKFEGKGYFYYHHDASNGDGQSNAFDFSRVYMGAKYKLSDEFTVRYLTDLGHQDKTGKLEVFAKYAYLDWTLLDNMRLVLGLQGTNNWKQPENAWGYRSIQYAPMEKFGKYWGDWSKIYSSYLAGWAADPTISSAESQRVSNLRANFNEASRSKMGASADLGVALKYKPSNVTYVNFMILNGSGYKHTEDDMFKNFQIRSGIYLMEKAVHISGYFEVEPWNSVDENGAGESYMNTQWDALLSYTYEKNFTLGVNVNSKVFSGIQDITATNFSVFGRASVMSKLNGFARYDMYNTGFNDAEFKAGETAWESNGGLIVFGVEYQAHKKISIIPNFQIMTYEDSDMDAVNSMYVHLRFKI
ncbi:MAG: hypothetical protein HN757_16125 [Calditrichaeota bacterium]|nr:hypothetical protein [Calditrichota bacterium]